jgi:hypothetical protein
MRALATYIMRGRMQAILVTAGMALSALLLPPLSWPLSYLSGATAVLVTLVHGPKEGLINVAGATLLVGLVTGLMLGQPLIATGYAVVQWLPIWILALVLYQQRSLVLVLFSIGLMGMMLVSMAYLLMDNPANWWYSYFTEQVIPAMESAGIQFPQDGELSAQLKLISALMTGMLVISFLFGYAISIFIGRWWQAEHYRPGAFGEEFRQIRIGKLVSILTIILAVAGMIGSDSIAEVCNNLLMPLALLFMFQGVAIVHSVNFGKSNRTWLVIMYLALALSLFMIFPYGVMFIMLLGLLDNGIDIRARVRPKK